MSNIKKYIFLSDSIRTIEDNIQKNRNRLNDEISNRHLREFIVKAFLFYGAAFTLIPVFKALEEISAFFLDYNAFICLFFFIFLDFIFFKFIIKKNKNKINFGYFSFALFVGCLIYLFAQFEPIFVLTASVFFRMGSLFFISCFSDVIFLDFITGRNTLRLFILKTAAELRASKNKLRELKIKKESLLQKMSKDKEDMKYILELKKGTLEFEHNLVSTDKGKEIIREEYDDVIEVFVKNSKKEINENEILDQIFNNQFEGVNIVNH